MVGHSIADFIQPNRLHLLDAYFDSLLQTGEAQGLFYLTHTNSEERVTAYRNRLIEEPGRQPYILAFSVAEAQAVLDRLWARGRVFLGTKLAIMGGAMTWVSERHLVAAISNAGGFGVIASGSMTA